jgi:hypothetical protein
MSPIGDSKGAVPPDGTLARRMTPPRTLPSESSFNALLLDFWPLRVGVFHVHLVSVLRHDQDRSFTTI